MNAKSVAGSFVIVVGLTIIGSTLWYSFLIFTDQRTPPQLFEAGLKTETARSAGLEEQISSVIEDQINSVLPPDAIPRILNLAVWSMFAGVAVFAGSQISSIGIKLLRA